MPRPVITSPHRKIFMASISRRYCDVIQADDRRAFLKWPERTQCLRGTLGSRERRPLSLIHTGQGRLGNQILTGLAFDVTAGRIFVQRQVVG